eukprot:scaffold90127_cov63-Phaeocystis_antarctica.AAC.12
MEAFPASCRFAGLSSTTTSASPSTATSYRPFAASKRLATPHRPLSSGRALRPSMRTQWPNRLGAGGAGGTGRRGDAAAGGEDLTGGGPGAAALDGGAAGSGGVGAAAWGGVGTAVRGGDAESRWSSASMHAAPRSVSDLKLADTSSRSAA